MAKPFSTITQSSGAIIRRLREERNLTMKDAADAADISRTYLWQIETSDHVPSFDIAIKLARVLGANPGNIWPIYAEKDDLQTEISLKEEKNMREQGRFIEIFLEVKASVSQRGSRYAETSYPLIDYLIAKQYIDRFAGLLGRDENDEVAQCLLTASLSENRENYVGAIEAYSEARRFVSDPNVIALIDWNIGNAYRELCKYAEAINYLERSLNWLEKKSVSLDDMAGIETSLGWLYYRYGYYIKARQYFVNAIESWKRLREDVETINSSGINLSHRTSYEDNYLAAFRGLGSVLERQGDFSGARNSFSEVDNVAKKNEDLVQLTWVTSRRGFLHIHTGDWTDAEEEMKQGMEKSGELIKTVPNRRSLQILQGIILNNQGLLHLRKGDFIKARELSEQSFNLSQELRDNRGGAFCHMFIAFAHVLKNEWDDALEHALMAENQFEEMKILYYLPELYCAQAEIFLNTTGAKGALPAAEKALALSIAPDSKSIYQEAIARRILGKVQARLGDLTTAEEQIKKSVELLNVVGEPYDLAFSHLVYAEILHDANLNSDLMASHVEQAELISNQLGAKGLLQRILDLKRN